MIRHALNKYDSGLPALQRYAASGDLDSVRAVLASGASLYTLDATMGASALHYAAQGGSVAIADLL